MIYYVLKITHYSQNQRTCAPSNPYFKVDLECDYKLHPKASLYSLKWYKEGAQFYQYIPKSPRKHAAYSVPGLRREQVVGGGDGRLVRLRRVTVAATGLYRCELVAEGPPFHTTQRQGNLTVAVVPTTPPTVTRTRDPHQMDDIITLNCTAPKSKPALHLEWRVNGRLVTNSSMIQHSEHVNPAGLYVVSSRLQLQVTRQQFERGDMTIQCSASLPQGLYGRSDSITISDPSKGWFVSGNLYLTSGETLMNDPSKGWFVSGNLYLTSGETLMNDPSKGWFVSGNLYLTSGETLMNDPSKGWFVSGNLYLTSGTSTIGWSHYLLLPALSVVAFVLKFYATIPPASSTKHTINSTAKIKISVSKTSMPTSRTAIPTSRIARSSARTLIPVNTISILATRDLIPATKTSVLTFKTLQSAVTTLRTISTASRVSNFKAVDKYSLPSAETSITAVMSFKPPVMITYKTFTYMIPTVNSSHSTAKIICSTARYYGSAASTVCTTVKTFRPTVTPKIQISPTPANPYALFAFHFPPFQFSSSPVNLELTSGHEHPLAESGKISIKYNVVPNYIVPKTRYFSYDYSSEYRNVIRLYERGENSNAFDYFYGNDLGAMEIIDQIKLHYSDTLPQVEVGDDGSCVGNLGARVICAFTAGAQLTLPKIQIERGSSGERLTFRLWTPGTDGLERGGAETSRSLQLSINVLALADLSLNITLIA
ncbi:CD80-like immunoglobulin C2-set [Trinorchestia longiramus]|nr:CD80-like immunoglobulin C2-set [Trinorchestia longiramus]